MMKTLCVLALQAAALMFVFPWVAACVTDGMEVLLGAKIPNDVSTVSFASAATALVFSLGGVVRWRWSLEFSVCSLVGFPLIQHIAG